MINYYFNKLNLIKSLIVDLLNTNPRNTTKYSYKYILKDFDDYFKSWLWLYYTNKKSLDKTIFYPYKLKEHRYSNFVIFEYLSKIKDNEFMKRYELFKNCINPKTKKPIKKLKATYNEIRLKEFSIFEPCGDDSGCGDYSYIDEIENRSRLKDFSFKKYIIENEETKKDIDKYNILINSLFIDYIKYSVDYIKYSVD